MAASLGLEENQAVDQVVASPFVSVVIPCLNEAETIAICVRKAKAAIERRGLAGEVIVVDNGSTDGSPQLAAEEGAEVLREARLVAARVSAQRRVYRLNPAPLLELEAWLEPYRKYWASRLDALGTHLDEHARASSRAGKPAPAPNLARAAARPRRARTRPSTSKRSTP